MNQLEGALKIEADIQRDEIEAKIRSLTVKRWLNSDEVALYLGRTPASIKKLKMRGKLRAKKYAGRNYYDKHEIDARIENSDLESTNQNRSRRWR